MHGSHHEAAKASQNSGASSSVTAAPARLVEPERRGEALSQAGLILQGGLETVHKGLSKLRDPLLIATIPG